MKKEGTNFHIPRTLPKKRNYMTKNERLALNELSTKVYGKPSTWMKMVTKGELGTLTRTLDDGTEEQYKGIVYSTIEEITKIMQELLEEEEDLKAKEELETAAKNQAAEIKKMAGEENPEAKEEVKETQSDTIKEILETIES